MHRACCLGLALLYFSFTFSQSDSAAPANHRAQKLVLGIGTGLGTVVSLVGLNQAWYSQYNTGSFHFFNDNKEWMQMDKAGHLYSSYQTSRLMMEAFQWAGYSQRSAVWVGGTVGFFYLTAIEVMDGFSRGWGYSWGDQLADGLGTGFAIAQQLAWKEQRINLKFSFAKSGLAKYNPNLLGDNVYSQLLKDYNGQTYWLSFNPTLFTAGKGKFPKWLDVSLGYAAYGMLGGHYNRLIAQDEKGNVLNVERERRFLLSLDINLNKLPLRSKVLKGICSVVNILKFPAPSLQFSKSGLRFYPVYY